VGKLLHVLVEQKKIRYTALLLPSLELVRAPGIDPGWLCLHWSWCGHQESIPAVSDSPLSFCYQACQDVSGYSMDIYGSIFLLICSTSFLRLIDDLVYFREFWVKPLTQN
jgi:hypothetical protein